MQTILGSGGTIGKPLAHELRKYTDQIRLVSRNPQKVNDTDELFPADLSDSSAIDRAIAGSEVVYVVVGFEYDLKVWQKSWPPFLRTVIDACKKQGAKLVFFDNMYLYAKTALPHMTESSPIDPPSKKGEVRRQLHDMIMNAVSSGELAALIARSADFYGPDNQKSALGIMVANNLLKGKKAQAFGDVGKIHNYTYTPDAAKATAILGNTPDAYGQVWHLPTTKEKMNTRQWIELIGKELNVKPGIQSIPNWMIKLIGVFNQMMREFPEMIYQNEMDYFFDSSKFEERFGWSATPPAEGVKAMIKDLKSSANA